MAYDLGEIGAVVTLNDKPYVDTINGIVKKSDSAFSKIAKMAAGLFGLNTIKNFVQDSVKAYIKQENAVNGLNRALRRIGEGRESKRLQEFAKEMQRVTSYGDETTIAIMKMGLNMGISAKQMEEATRAAIGLSAGFDNIDVTTAMQLVGKAVNGNTAMLSRYGIKLSETGTKQEKFNELLKKGNDLFQLATADTFGQRLIQLGNAWGDLKEQIGDFILQLTGFYDSMDGAKSSIEIFTKYFAENLDYWAFYVRYYAAYVKSYILKIIAYVEPAFDYVVSLINDAMENATTIINWFGDNWGKIWENLPDIAMGVLKDILNLFKNFATTLLDLASNLGSAIWKAIKGEGFGGFKQVWDDLVADAEKTFLEIGENTAGALNRAGAQLPELKKTASIDKLINAYTEELPFMLEGIEKVLEEDVKNAQSGMTNALNRKRDQNFDKGNLRDPVEEASKGDVAGSFSAAMLNAMIGANSPEKETAKNTRQMVEQQKETNQKLETGAVYV